MNRSSYLVIAGGGLISFLFVLIVFLSELGVADSQQYFYHNFLMILFSPQLLLTDLVVDALTFNFDMDLDDIALIVVIFIVSLPASMLEAVILFKLKNVIAG